MRGAQARRTVELGGLEILTVSLLVLLLLAALLP